ncbi:LCP family protein [Candidatus Nomurabacteria bacterium]|uniref:LCP family protein n=1 Tax=Candidatus Dojkabacteria bacterium TaxID=2099670 RepID=A0A955KXD9_9BACT|nr:LCP family protein [Candidatus Dojkabacteria bacterium]MCB9789457.1 LCP family protein [Candidatus Nomurabacteria bacterium]MCB9803779.1 LCP family protein [Candidatus Nomurabacteria bacterium]
MSLSININDSNKVMLENRNLPSDPGNNKSRSRSSMSSKKKIILVILGVILLVGITSFGKILGYTKDLGLKISAGDIISPIKKDPQLRTDSSGIRTNALLVGIDTRETNQGLQNTDTIIVASYNKERNDVEMISIPRDTYVEIPEANWNIKINGIYNRAENEEEGTGLEALKSVVEEYTGLEIQYYVMVDVKALTNIIDIMGGIEVYVENSFTDYAYPDETNPYSDYQVVSFDAGPQTMDGDTAVKFSRSRKSLDNNEGSDFARARRQQKVLEAIKNKLLSTDTFLDPDKLYSILAELRDHIKVSEFTNEDVQAGLQLASIASEVKIFSFVLDPSVGGGTVLITNQIPDAYSISPAAGLGVYKDINELVGLYLEEPEIYAEDALIYVYDVGLGYQEAYDLTTELSEKFPYLRIIFRGTLFSDKTGSYVYSNSGDDEYDVTAKRLGTIVGSRTHDRPDFITNRLNGEDVVILLGGDLVTDTPSEESTQ